MRLIQAIRGFFDGRGFLEVETPALQVCPGVETHLHPFKTSLHEPDLVHIRDLHLHTSPEFAMKKLLVAGLPKIYQICHVWRNGENTRLHSPEFTMIEWYRASADYKTMMQDCVDLFRHCAEKLGISGYRSRGKACDPFRDWQRISVAQAFLDYAGIDLSAYLEDRDGFAAVIAAKGIRVAQDDRWDDLFFRVMAEKIEPFLGFETPCILYDYPAALAPLCIRTADPRFSERFELYICGIELANAFSELTDAAEQRKRFEEELTAKQAIYGYTYPIDEDFLKALEYGMPQSGGIALGIDRMAMLAAGVDNIEEVLWTGRI